MDLASYLLKPIQRMSKYALLLKDLIKEVSEAQEQELSYLRAAAEMVKFQLRHGNDLLAMDAIRDCDVSHTFTSHTPKSLLQKQSLCLNTGHVFMIKSSGIAVLLCALQSEHVILRLSHTCFLFQVNLKEQGQLVRQDEFTIWYGRKKCQRHVFLFEDLVLFSKPKRIEGGLDVYIYKHSFKVNHVSTPQSGVFKLSSLIIVAYKKNQFVLIL